MTSSTATILESVSAAQLWLQAPVVTVNVPEEAHRLLWVDLDLETFSTNPELWRLQLAQLTGAPILDLHLQDALNAGHPSYFDSTQTYDMVIFRKLTMHNETGENPHSTPPPRSLRNRIPALQHIDTQPVVFFVFKQVLLTIQPGQSRTIAQIRSRILQTAASEAAPNQHTPRLPTTSEDLTLRLLNSMVDRYLELRTPLTRQLDRWQRALLDPRRPFSGWQALLDARAQIRRLEHLCEEQHDAVQEFRDNLLENRLSDIDNHAILRPQDDALLVRVHDVIEHINRVLSHARRLQDSIESAVQIHFAAVAHRTNRSMQMLTIITALFMPLTLITGIFGMNFDVMPWVHHPTGFWWSLVLMAALVAGMLGFFYLKRYLER